MRNIWRYFYSLTNAPKFLNLIWLHFHNDQSHHHRRLRSSELFTNSMLSAMTRRRLRKPLRYFRSKTQQNRYTIASMNINWIILADIGDIAAKPKRIYQQQQRETTMDGRNCHSVVRKYTFVLKTKMPHNLEIYLVAPFFTGQNWIAWSKMIRNFWQDWRSSSFNHPPMR